MKTVILNNGIEVIAKEDKYGVSALKYVNRTQATRKANEIGGTVYHPLCGPVFYVRPAQEVK